MQSQNMKRRFIVAMFTEYLDYCACCRAIADRIVFLPAGSHTREGRRGGNHVTSLTLDSRQCMGEPSQRAKHENEALSDVSSRRLMHSSSPTNYSASQQNKRLKYATCKGERIATINHVEFFSRPSWLSIVMIHQKFLGNEFRLPIVSVLPSTGKTSQICLLSNQSGRPTYFSLPLPSRRAASRPAEKVKLHFNG